MVMPPPDAAFLALRTRLSERSAYAALLALSECGMEVVPINRYQRPQDTSALPSLRCPGAQKPPKEGSIVTFNNFVWNKTGECRSCGRRLRLYPTGMVAVHKPGR